MHKSTIATLALILTVIFLPTVALARHHRHRPVVTPVPVPMSPTPVPQPAPSPSPAVTGNKCMNIGHDGQVTSSEITMLKNAHINCARLYYSSWGDPTSRAQALTLKNAGLSVVMGGWYGIVNQSDLNAYDALVVTDAKWAEQNGIQQFSLGNEQETNLGNLSEAQWAAHLDTLYPKVAAVYHGTISYEMNSEHMATYKNVQSPILFGINLYNDDYATNAGAVQQGITYWGRVYVSETSCNMQYSNDCPTDAARAAETKADFLKMVANFPQTKFYYFTLQANGDSGVPSQWGLQDSPLTRATLGL